MTGNRPKQVLVCPLNWGLGHATRCVPVIHELISQGFSVTLAAEGPPLEFLKREFPELTVIVFPGYSPDYPEGKGMVWKMLKSIPSFLAGIRKEQRFLDTLVSRYAFDIVISDNRYGLWNRKVKSILMIHQLMIKTPGWFSWFEPFLWLVNKILMRRFDRVWVPDFPGEQNLSGDLSHKYPQPKKSDYVGPLSRFSLFDPLNLQQRKHEVLAIVSGPEPQRSVFEKILTEQLSNSGIPCTLVRGKPDDAGSNRSIRNLTVYPHLDSRNLYRKMSEASLIISRPGYSTLMDMAVTGGKALFVPTPGQTEQEYLAAKFEKEGIAFSVEQDKLNVEENIEMALHYKGFDRLEKNERLASVIRQLAQ